MSNTAVSAKAPQDIEYKVLGNAIGLLVALFGLLAGAMVNHFSLEYWREDIVQLVLVAIMVFRLLGNVTDVITLSQEPPPPPPRRRDPNPEDDFHPEGAVVGQIAAKTGYTEEQVVEEVVKRIEAKKAEAAKSSKFAN